MLRQALNQTNQSPNRIVYSSLDRKRWMEQTPSVDLARPAQCPLCENPSRPCGGPLGLWGHGLRERQQRGPLTPEGEPQIVGVTGRRYQCQRCSAILLVVPRGVLPRRQYSGAAIALALTLWGLLDLSLPEVRKRISPWPIVGDCAVSEWATLRRWVQAIQEGTLFPEVRPSPPEFTKRQVAARAATTFCAMAGPQRAREGPESQAFFGGMQMR